VLLRFTERGIELANPQRNFLVGMPDGVDVEGRETGEDDDVNGSHEGRERGTRRAQSAAPGERTSRNGSSGDGSGAGRKPS
jgi:moderate conductance mechanosensitive channel